MRGSVLEAISRASVEAIHNLFELGTKVELARRCQSEMKRTLGSCCERMMLRPEEQAEAEAEADEACTLSGLLGIGRLHDRIGRRNGAGAA